MTSLMRCKRWSKGMKALFMPLIVAQRISFQPQSNASTSFSELLRHRDVTHQAVVGVDRDAEAQVGQESDRMFLDGAGRAGVHVRRRTHLERNAEVTDVAGQATELRDAAVDRDVGDDVVDDAHAVAESFGAAELQRFPDRRAGRTPLPRGS